MLLAGCAKPHYDSPPTYLDTAYTFLGYSEEENHREIKAFIGFNPRHTEWCAGFINKILEYSGYHSVDTLGLGPPLLARSYLKYGELILEDEVQQGDILIFKRGRSQWKGHVGFYVGEEVIKGKTYYRVLGGNQSNEVNISLYPKYKLLGIRRPVKGYNT